MTWPTVLFDLDGTLIDSIELIFESYRHTLRVHRGTVPPDDVWLNGLGTPLTAQLREFTSDPDELQAMIATYREWNLANHDDMVRPYPGAVEIVRHLKKAGRKLGIVTAKNRHGTLKGLDLIGVADCFDVLICADSLEAHKPDPAPVLMAVRELGGTPAESVMIGDSPHDIAAGREAGARTVAVLWGPFSRERLSEERPDHFAENFARLERLLLD